MILIASFLFFLFGLHSSVLCAKIECYHCEDCETVRKSTLFKDNCDYCVVFGNKKENAPVSRVCKTGKSDITSEHVCRTVVEKNNVRTDCICTESFCNTGNPCHDVTYNNPDTAMRSVLGDGYIEFEELMGSTIDSFFNDFSHATLDAYDNMCKTKYADSFKRLRKVVPSHYVQSVKETEELFGIMHDKVCTVLGRRGIKSMVQSLVGQQEFQIAYRMAQKAYERLAVVKQQITDIIDSPEAQALYKTPKSLIGLTEETVKRHVKNIQIEIEANKNLVDEVVVELRKLNDSDEFRRLVRETQGAMEEASKIKNDTIALFNRNLQRLLDLFEKLYQDMVEVDKQAAPQFVIDGTIRPLQSYVSGLLPLTERYMDFVNSLTSGSSVAYLKSNIQAVRNLLNEVSVKVLLSDMRKLDAFAVKARTDLYTFVRATVPLVLEKADAILTGIERIMDTDQFFRAFNKALRLDKMIKAIADRAYTDVVDIDMQKLIYFVRELEANIQRLLYSETFQQLLRSAEEITGQKIDNTYIGALINQLKSGETELRKLQRLQSEGISRDLRDFSLTMKYLNESIFGSTFEYAPDYYYNYTIIYHSLNTTYDYYSGMDNRPVISGPDDLIDDSNKIPRYRFVLKAMRSAITRFETEFQRSLSAFMDVDIEWVGKGISEYQKLVNDDSISSRGKRDTLKQTRRIAEYYYERLKSIDWSVKVGGIPDSCSFTKAKVVTSASCSLKLVSVEAVVKQRDREQFLLNIQQSAKTGSARSRAATTSATISQDDTKTTKNGADSQLPVGLPDSELLNEPTEDIHDEVFVNPTDGLDPEQATLGLPVNFDSSSRYQAEKAATFSVFVSTSSSDVSSPPISAPADLSTFRSDPCLRTNGHQSTLSNKFQVKVDEPDEKLRKSTGRQQDSLLNGNTTPASVDSAHHCVVTGSEPGSPASSCGSVVSTEVITSFGLNIHRIDKDVRRCDRNYSYFMAEDNLEKLRNIMCSYVWENREIGYVQGMCDILAPLLVIFDNEPLAYSCFSLLMCTMGENFPTHGNAMDTRFSNMRAAVQVFDSELFEHMHRTGDYTHFYFCYRWFLLDFKREFPYRDVFAVWEVIWAASHITTRHFPLFVGLAFLQLYRQIILDLHMDFTDIIKFFNEMAEKHDVTAVLSVARHLVRRLREFSADSTPHTCSSITGP